MGETLLSRIERWLLFDPDVPLSPVTTLHQGSVEVFVDGLNIVWYRLVTDPEVPVILYAHGNGGSIGTRHHIVSMFRSFGKANLVLFDYSGFGKSKGMPSQEQVLIDTLKVYDYLVKGSPFGRSLPFRPDQIIGWGESFGGAVIGYLAQERPQIKGIVLMSTFPSLSWMVGKMYGSLVRMGFDRFAADRLDTAKRLRESIRVPVVVLHSHDDDLIPIEAGMELVRAFPSETTRLIVIGGTHHRPEISEHQFNEIFKSIDS